MSANVVNARAKILGWFAIVSRSQQSASFSAIVITSFMDAKSDELEYILKKAPRMRKTSCRNFSDVQPTQSDKYEKILN